MNRTSPIKPEHGAESREADGLNPEQRMLGHAGRRCRSTSAPRRRNVIPGKSEKTRSHVGPLSQFGNGRSHPPSHSVTAIEDTAIMAEYSARKNNDQRKPLYSVWNPAVNSDSASGRSNGARLVSATMAMAKMKKATSPSGKNLKTNHIALRLLRLHDADHAQRAGAVGVEAGHQDGGNHGEAHRHFVRNHLRAGAQRADQRIVRVGSPSRRDDAQHAERRHAQHEEDADVHVGDGMRGAERNDNENREGRAARR